MSTSNRAPSFPGQSAPHTAAPRRVRVETRLAGVLLAAFLLLLGLSVTGCEDDHGPIGEAAEEIEDEIDDAT